LERAELVELLPDLAEGAPGRERLREGDVPGPARKPAVLAVPGYLQGATSPGWIRKDTSGQSIRQGAFRRSMRIYDAPACIDILLGASVSQASPPLIRRAFAEWLAHDSA
jgi:hypothetical protein